MNQPAKKSEKIIATHPSARSDYFLLDTFEAGIELKGTEVKSLRLSSPNLKDAFVNIVSKANGAHEAWLYNTNIAHYQHGNIWNHEPTRKRKLLLHKFQIERLFSAHTREGLTIIPTKFYFKNGLVKVEIALAKGKKKYDKREDSKKKSTNKEIRSALKRKQRG